jgi:hypothetical protein
MGGSLSKREGLFIVSPLSFFSLVLLFSVEPYWGFDPPPNPLILSPFYSNVMGALGYPVGCHCSSLRNSLAHIPVCTPFEGEGESISPSLFAMANQNTGMQPV